jgi:ParB-like chromosome segregation protein Spo0J
MSRQAKREKRRLGCLRPHPLQRVYFDDLSPDDLEALAEDIRRNGLRQPPEVLPDGTILDGHQRVSALRRLGETETIVLVRYDLEDDEEAAEERAFLTANLTRRQLDPLAKARGVLRLYEIERKRRRGQLDAAEEAEARDRIGKAIGVSGRTLSRYLRVLRTPVEVQNAFRAGRLSLVAAEKVADLAGDVQRAVAGRIRGGDDPKAVLAAVLPAPDGRHRKAGDALASLVRHLRCGVHDLDGRVDRVSRAAARQELDLLRRAKSVLDRLIRLGQEPER